MVTANTLAPALLEFVSDPDVVGTLLPYVGNGDHAPKLAAAPTPTVAVRQARRGAAFAVLIANASTDPDTLATLAGFNQKSVRRAVAANPHTPLAAQEKLLDWALRTANENETRIALAATMPTLVWLRCCVDRFQIVDTTWAQTASSFTPDGTNRPRLPEAHIVEGIVRRADPTEARDVFSLDIPMLSAFIGVAAATAEIAVPFGELYDSVSSQRQVTMLLTLLENSRQALTDDAVDRICAWLDDNDLDAGPDRLSTALSRPVQLSDYGVAKFVHSGHDLLRQAVATSVARGEFDIDDELLGVLCRTASYDTASSLLSSSTIRARCTIEQIGRLAKDFHPIMDPVAALFKDRGHELPEEVILDLVRGLSKPGFSAWLTGSMALTPTAAQLDALIADPLGSRTTKPKWVGRGEMTARTFLTSMIGRIDVYGVFSKPGMDVVLNYSAPALMDLAADRSETMPDVTSFDLGRARKAFRAYLASRMAVRFGDRPQAWTVLMDLAGQLNTGSVDDLLTIIDTILHTGSNAA